MKLGVARLTLPCSVGFLWVPRGFSCITTDTSFILSDLKGLEHDAYFSIKYVNRVCVFQPRNPTLGIVGHCVYGLSSTGNEPNFGFRFSKMKVLRMSFRLIRYTSSRASVYLTQQSKTRGQEQSQQTHNLLCTKNIDYILYFRDNDIL